MNTIKARRAAADSEYESYYFGGVVVEGADGWAHSSPGDSWTRSVYIREQVGAATEKVTFTVVFESGGDKVSHAYAITGKGEVFGERFVPAAPEAMHLTIDLTLLRKTGPFPSEAAAIDWIKACLNCNTNHVVATVRRFGGEVDRRPAAPAVEAASINTIGANVSTFWDGVLPVHVLLQDSETPKAKQVIGILHEAELRIGSLTDDELKKIEAQVVESLQLKLA
ncbi:hypothetical protein [Rubrivivax gelatinosus]|uniref:hypothetical protein n=1 Tax=Rubrivivax gelatinosus TaxID=28068 RepID=UPI000303765B|nr:hypothetical protein [Rubrivivax gelatinosus]MBG6083118.1 hypothetical protein [Rubrivivax gelatinosus]